VIDITGCGDGRTNPRLDRPDDLDDSLPAGDKGVDPVTRANLARRLCADAVDADVPAVAQLGRDGTCLDEARGAQPAIDPGLIGRRAITHTVYWTTKRTVLSGAPIGMGTDSPGGKR